MVNRLFSLTWIFHLVLCKRENTDNQTFTIKHNIIKMRTLLYSVQILFLTFFQPTFVNAQAIIHLETGAVYNGFNDVRIPGNQGTLFSLTDDLKAETNLFFRLSATYIIKSRHSISVLYAPLETKSKGSIPRDIFFEGEIFKANTQLNSTYKFNSYRLTYRYDIVKKPKFEFGLGITAKIRDAKIAISSADLLSEKTNVGFVPIINFRLLWKIDEKFAVLLDGDALAAPQGRAEDVLLAATYNLSDHLNILAGYRILEGGADNAVVYNFSFFHYASVGISYTFLNTKSNTHESFSGY
jgi:hypothetical protein